jgi:uncharacterized protein (TIGR02646 family)
MIYCDRSSVRVPEELFARAIEATRRLTIGQASTSLEERIQFRSQVWMGFKPFLRELFHGKCAFCESHLDAVTFGEIEHFRPKTDARQLSGETSPAHYYWLAYEWTNLYHICQKCNYNKRTLFPVLGERVAIATSALEERVLLLDPCADNPEDYLVFSTDGIVSPRELPPQELEKYDGIHRGEITIQVFGLNREELVQARKQAALAVLTLQRLLLLATNKDERQTVSNQLENVASPASEFSAIAKQMLLRGVDQPSQDRNCQSRFRLARSA